MTKFSQIFHAPSKTVTSAAFLLAIAALLSRMLGLARDRILAGTFGAGNELDVYFAAFRVPDFVFQIVIAGAVSSAFIPMFMSLYAKNKEEAWRAANNFLNIAIFSLVVLGGIAVIFTPVFTPFVTPGFEGEKYRETVGLTRILFLSLVFLGLSAIFSGILHSFKRFLAYALAPVFYNLGIIFGALVLVKYLGIYGLAWGVVLGSFLHFVIQIPSAFASGFLWQKVFDFRDSHFQKIFFLMVPRAVGLGIYQMNLWVVTAIASTLQAGSVAIFHLANNLEYLPIGIIGISFAVAVFPSLSEFVSYEKKKEFIGEISSAARVILFFVVPLSVLIFVLRAHIVRIILGTGEFGWSDTRLTAASLGLFCFGIFAQSLIPLFSRAFYALHNTKTPVILNSIGMALNVVLSLLFVFWIFTIPEFRSFVSRFLHLEGIENLQLLGLPLAFSISGILNLAILFTVFQKRIGVSWDSGLLGSGVKIFVASMVSGVLAYGILFLVGPFVNTKTVLGLSLQAGIATTAGAVAYVLLMLVFRAPELNSFQRLFKGRLRLSAYPHEHEINGR
ncbi:MAG: murein biosynthesis integral membrane protein MurJ [Candidatus Spechtbacteria bacterium]|nr:murein biosynthesis integral membrane protein MurJ [Candidatus Spechtbacteria bacterium]